MRAWEHSLIDQGVVDKLLSRQIPSTVIICNVSIRYYSSERQRAPSGRGNPSSKANQGKAANNPNLRIGSPFPLD